MSRNVSIARLAKFLRDKKISFDEFASNMIIHLVGLASEDIDSGLGLLSKIEKKMLKAYAKNYFENNDYSPHPVVFMADIRDELAVTNKTNELRPKYVRLMQELDRLIDD